MERDKAHDKDQRSSGGDLNSSSATEDGATGWPRRFNPAEEPNFVV